MNYPLIVMGILAIIYGGAILILKKKSPQRLTKLTEMQERLGDKKANRFYAISYGLLPVLVGMIVILAEVIKEIYMSA